MNTVNPSHRAKPLSLPSWSIYDYDNFILLFSNLYIIKYFQHNNLSTLPIGGAGVVWNIGAGKIAERMPK